MLPSVPFWQGICVVTDSQEELDTWIEACRQERRKPKESRRHGQEILEEIRREAAAEQ
jgi:hypothetical protein